MSSTTLKTLATDDLDIVAKRFQMLAVATNERDALNAIVEKAYLAILDEHAPKLAKLGRTMEFAEKVIFAIAEEHPEWFQEERNLKTVFGVIKCRRVTSHEFADEEHSIRLIEAAAEKCGDDLVAKARLLGLIRVKKELNIEAVECLAEKELTRLQIVRVRRNSLSITVTKPTAKRGSKAKKIEEAPTEAKAA